MLDVLTLNVSNPGLKRATRLAEWLVSRPEHIVVLTGVANTGGSGALEDRFVQAGRRVIFPRPPERPERGVMIASRLETWPLTTGVPYLPHRAVGLTVDSSQGPIDIIGLHPPTRNRTAERLARRRRFLEECRMGLPVGQGVRCLVLGSYNVVEPEPDRPRNEFFDYHDYEFYEWFEKVGYTDAFRRLHPEARVSSWFSRAGIGYRFDHAHVSERLAVTACSYDHELRLWGDTEHSALSVSLGATPIGAVPLHVGGQAPALI